MTNAELNVLAEIASNPDTGKLRLRNALKDCIHEVRRLREKEKKLIAAIMNVDEFCGGCSWTQKECRERWIRRALQKKLSRILTAY